MTSLSEVSDYLEKLLDRLQAGATQVVEGVVTTTTQRYRLFNGDYYEQFYLFEDVDDGETVSLLMSNPDATEADMVTDITTFSIQTVGKIDVTTTHNVTVDSEGAELTPRNKDTGVDDDADTEIFRGGSYSSGDDSMTATVPGGRGQVELGTIFKTETQLISDGDNFLVELFNDAGRTIDVSIQTEFFEVERLT